MLDLLSESQDGLDCQVHDCHSLSTEVIGENLERVGNQQTGETDIVEDTEDPDKDDLSDAKSHGSFLVIHSSHDGPQSERQSHSCNI